MRLTWIGHSTVVLDLDGVRLVTDPLLRRWIGHVTRIGRPVVDALAEIDVVLVSHVHHDHLDLPSLARFARSVPVVVPRGAGSLVRRRGFRDVVEVTEGEELRVGAVVVRATHAEHDAARGPFGLRAPALGFLACGSARAYFAGDTDLFPGMAELADGLDVALLPVDGWGPKVAAGHLDPDRAAQALTLLRPRAAIPIHWGTYRRIGMPRDAATLARPAAAFVRLAGERAPEVDVRVVPVGGSVELPAPRDATRARPAASRSGLAP